MDSLPIGQVAVVVIVVGVGLSCELVIGRQDHQPIVGLRVCTIVIVVVPVSGVEKDASVDPAAWKKKMW